MRKIQFKAKFKKADIYSTTLYLVVYPQEGLITTGKLSEIEEGEDIVVTVKRNS